MYLTALCKLLPQYEPKEGAEALWLPLIPRFLSRLCGGGGFNLVRVFNSDFIGVY